MISGDQKYSKIQIYREPDPLWELTALPLAGGEGGELPLPKNSTPIGPRFSGLMGLAHCRVDNAIILTLIFHNVV